MLRYSVEPSRRMLLEKLFPNQLSGLRKRLKQTNSPTITQSAQERILQQFATHMDWMLIPTIAVEVNSNFHKENYYKLSPKQTRYLNFVSKDVDSIKQLFNNKYYNLYDDLVNRANRVIEHIDLLLQRIQKDWIQICNSFLLCQESLISSIDIFAGDPHAGKNTVIIELEDNTAFIYKPVSIALDNALQDIIEWSNGSDGPPLKKVNSITKDGYGYFEFIKYAPLCLNEQEIINFHRCLGKHLALDSALGTVDGHMENIIAVRDTPYRVDLETSFHVITNYQEENFSTIEQSGLLTNTNKTPDNWPIVSGIQAGTIPRMAFFAPFILNDGTDHIEVQYRRISNGKVTNRIYIKDELIHPENYIDEIIEGFNMMFRWIVTHKEQLLDLVKYKVLNENTISRHLFRGTAFYALLTKRLFLPEVRQLGNIKQQLAEATSILDNPDNKLDSLKEEFKKYHEFRDILNFDIPYFYRPLKTNDLYASNGSKFENFFSSDIIKDMRNRLIIFEQSFEKNKKSIKDCLLSTKVNQKKSLEKV